MAQIGGRTVLKAEREDGVATPPWGSNRSLRRHSPTRSSRSWRQTSPCQVPMPSDPPHQAIRGGRTVEGGVWPFECFGTPAGAAGGLAVAASQQVEGGLIILLRLRGAGGDTPAAAPAAETGVGAPAVAPSVGRPGAVTPAAAPAAVTGVGDGGGGVATTPAPAAPPRVGVSRCVLGSATDRNHAQPRLWRGGSADLRDVIYISLNSRIVTGGATMIAPVRCRHVAPSRRGVSATFRRPVTPLTAAKGE